MSDSIKGKILWADDEINFLESHILFLRDKGYDVTPVNSGEDAITIIKSNNFDLVLLDEMMTGIDGLETLKYIKQTQPDIPVIMITKNEEEWLMDEAIASHISNYLLKPVSPNQIFMACKNLIEKTNIVNHIKQYPNIIWHSPLKQICFDDDFKNEEHIPSNNEVINYYDNYCSICNLKPLFLTDFNITFSRCFHY